MADVASAPDTRCRHCGLRASDHGKMSGGCFVQGRAVRTRFEAVDATTTRPRLGKTALAQRRYEDDFA